MIAHNFDEYLSVIKCLIAQQDAEYRDRIWFRGETEVRPSLQPSLFRSNKELDNKSLYNAETHLTNHFQIKASRYLSSCPESTCYHEWISLMQHYGLPTRMLDWTSSPLVALYFATRKWDKKKCEAVIYVLFPRRLNEAEGFGPYIPPMFSQTVNSALAPAFSSKKESARIINGSILACHATSNDERAHMQQSSFTIQTSPDRTIKEACSCDALFEIRLPTEAQEYLFYGVRTFGITEDFLNPDLEHIATESKRLGIERSRLLYSLAKK